MDIWEANSISTAYTPHPCDTPGQTMCTGNACGGTYSNDRYAGTCDPDGCDFNSYRQGNLDFYGPGKTVDTKKKFTVVTQFITNDNTATGTLTEIRRIWVQGGVVFQNAKVEVPGIPAVNSITDSFCTAAKSVFGDTNSYSTKGGMKAMGDSLGRGHVLVMSLWADYAAEMRWLDSNWPADKDASLPGVARGTCATNAGNPANLIKNVPNSQVTFSNIKFGDIGSTFNNAAVISTTLTTSTRTSTAPATTTTATTGGTLAKFAQCGGIGWTGTGTCVAGTTCTVNNEYYSQCL